MADQVLEGGVGVAAAVGADEGGREVDADHAAALADRGELAVGEVARMRADRVHVRMGRDERRVGEPGDVPEALLVQMREVDHHAEPVAGLDEGAAVIGQARPGVGARRIAERDAVAEHVRAAPDRADRAQARLVEHVEQAQVRIDRLGALDMHDRGEGAALVALADLRRAAHHLDLAAGGALDAQEQRGHVQGRALRLRDPHLRRQRHVVLRPRHHRVDVEALLVLGGREDGEEATGKAARPHPRPVEMAGGVAFEEGPLRVRAAAAHESQENVVVAVEDGNEGRRHEKPVRDSRVTV